MQSNLNLNHYLPFINFDNCSFKVHYWGDSPRHFNNQLHQHSFWEAVLILEGEGQYYEKGQSYPIKSDTLFLSRPKILHQIKSEVGLKLFFIGFEPDLNTISLEWRNFLNSIFSNNNIIKTLSSDHEIIKTWIKIQQFPEDNSKHILLKEKLKIFGQYLLFFILNEFSTLENLNIAESTTNKHAKNTEFITIKQFVQDNLHLNLQLEEVAEFFYMSGRNLSRLFTNYEKMTFTDYKTKIRMEKAIDLIHTTDKSIGEISQLVGFSTVQYFSNVFTKYMNISPQQYKKRYLSSNKLTK